MMPLKMLRNPSLLALLLLFPLGVWAQGTPPPEDTPIWQTLTRIEWRFEYNEELEYELGFPIWTPAIQALEGKEITITGFIIPIDVDGDYVVLSMNPYAACFFCGAAGPETVMEVYLKNSNQRLKRDDLVTLTGRLELNGNDFEHLIYRLKAAEITKAH